MDKYEDLKVFECENDKILISMNKSTYDTICKILDWASKEYRKKRKEAELI